MASYHVGQGYIIHYIKIHSVLSLISISWIVY